MARRSLLRGTAGWAISIAIGIAIGYALNGAGLDAEGWLLGVALSTTALGTLVPILADARLLSTTLGSAVLGAGVAGEFWPILVVSIFLTGAYGALTETLLLLLFGAIVLLAAAGCAPRAPAARRPRAAADRAHDEPGRRAAVRVHAGRPRLRLGRSGLRLRARGVRRRPRRRPGAELAGGQPGADAPRGRRLRLPRPDLLRRHGDELRPRQPADARGHRPGGALPRALPRRPRGAGAALAARSGAATRRSASPSSAPPACR